MPLFCATGLSMPVLTIGGSVRSSGTAWRCMLLPIRARLASSCSRNGISAAETETVCRGLMSTYCTSLAGDGRQVALHAGQDQPLAQLPVFFNHVRRSEDRLHFLVGAEVFVLAVDLAVLDHAVGRDEESVFVDVAVDGQRRDQTDVGAFGRFDRADSAVVGNMHVADFEARALAVQTARAQGRQTPLVGQLAQRDWSDPPPAKARRGRRRNRSSC